MFYGYGNVTTPSNKINVGGTITVNASNAANYTQLVIELWKMNGNTKVTRLDRETIPITKEGQKGQKGDDGETPFVVDIDNEMTSIPISQEGKVVNQIELSFNIGAFYGQTNVIDDCSVALSGTAPSGFSVDTTTQKSNPRITIAANTQPAEITELRFKVKHSTYGEREAVFSIAAVKSGGKGEDAVLYELLPSESQISVGRTDAGGYNPSTASLKCGYTKKAGTAAPTTVEDATGAVDGYSIYFRRYNRSSGWGYIYNYVSYKSSYLTGFSVATYSKVQFFLCKNTQSYLTSESGLTGLIDKETVPVVADGQKGSNGTSAFILDIDNEMAAIPVNTEGKVESQIQLTFGLEAYYGTGAVTSACSISVGSLPSGFHVNTDNKSAPIVTIDQNTQPAEITEITFTAVHATYGTREAVFTVCAVKSGGKGADAELYQLLPNYTSFQFQRDSNGNLTGSFQLTCQIQKIVGSVITNHDSLSGYNIYYGWDSVASPTTNWTGFLNITTSHANSYKNIVLELWRGNRTSGTRLDRETIPITKEGQKGQKGDDGETPFVVDIDNEMTSIPISQEGKVVNQIELSFNIGAFYGQTNVIDDCSVALSGTAPSGFSVDTTTQKSNPRITIAANTQPAEITELRFKVKHSTYGEREAVFSIAAVKSGGKGEDAVLYELLPSESQISVGRTDAGGYNPSTASLKCGYTKKAGTAAPTTVEDATGAVDGYSIYFRRYNRSSGWGYIYNYVSYKSSYLTGFSVATYSKVQFFLCKNTQSYLTSESGLTGLIDKETVPVVADGQKGSNGTSAFILDIDNEMAAIPVNTEGKVESQIQLTFGLEAYYGTGAVTSACSISVGSLPSGFHVNTDNKSAPIVTIDQNTQPAEITEITFTAVHATYGTREAVFTVCAVKSGGKGADAELYQLLPNYTSFQFQRDSNGNLTGSFQLTCQIQKIVGSVITNHDSLSGYNIYYGWDSVASPTTNWTGFLNITTSHANSYKNIVLELWRGNRTSGTRLDRETIPLLRDGSKGAGGDEGNGIDTVTLARMFTTNFVQPSNTDSGWINEGASNYPTEAGLSDVNHYLWQQKRTTYTKSTDVTYEVVLFAQFIDGVHENLLDDTAFLSEGEMEAWDDKNGTIGQKTIGNHNSFGGTPVWENQYTELLRQTVYKYGTVQKLKPNTWYTLSFYGAMVAYQDMLTSSVYNGSDGGSYWQIGASLKSFCLDPGQSALITVTGRCYSTSVFLRVFGFRDDWGGGMTKSIDFKSTSSETKSFKLTNTGTSAALFRVCGYVYLTDGSETQNSYSDINHRAYITLIRLDRGCKLNTYLYRSDNGQAVQHSASAPWYVDGKKFTSRGSLQDSNTGHVVTVNGVQENVHDGTVVNFTDDGSVLWQMSAGTLRHSVTFKTPSSLSSSAEYRVLFRLAQYSHYGWISMPKLEEGTAATDWIESSNDRKAEDIQHVFVGNWVASTQGDKSTYYFFGGGTGVRHVVRARKSASGAYTYWRMKQRTTSEGYYSTAQPYNDTAHWEQADYLKFIAAEFALIDEAIIKFTQTNRILVYNSAGTVAAGMGGAPGGSNDFPLWVGASYENRANAAFRVTLLGKMYATGCVISGDSKFSGQLVGATGTFSGSLTSNDNKVLLTSTGVSGWGLSYTWRGFAVSNNGFVGGDLATIGARLNAGGYDYGRIALVKRPAGTSSSNSQDINIVLSADDGSVEANIVNAGSGTINRLGITNCLRLNSGITFHTFYKKSLTSNNTIYDMGPTSGSIQIVNSTADGGDNKAGVILPQLADIYSMLGLTSGTNFVIRFLVCADLGSNNFYVYGRNNIKTSSNEHPWNNNKYPLMTHWDGGHWDRSEMGAGDTMEFLLVYDSSRTTNIDGYDTKYTARIINRQD